VYAAHAQAGCGDPERGGVIENVLIGYSLGTTVGGAEAEHAVLGYAVNTDDLVGGCVAIVQLDQLQILKIAIHLVRAGEDDRCPRSGLAHSLQHVEGAARVHLKIFERLIEARCYCRLGCEMKYGFRIADCILYGGEVADIGAKEMNFVPVTFLQPSKVVFHTEPAEIVEDDDILAFTQKTVGQIT